jgi:hypothetical protein
MPTAVILVIAILISRGDDTCLSSCLGVFLRDKFMSPEIRRTIMGDQPKLRAVISEEKRDLHKA